MGSYGKYWCPDLAADRLDGTETSGVATAVTVTAGLAVLGCTFTALLVIQIHLVGVVRRPTDRIL